MSFTRELLAQGGSAARLVEDLVREADTGVAEIRVDCVYAHELAESRTLTPEAISQILRSQRADDDTAKPRRFEVVRTRHAGTDGATATFEVSEESSGTQRLFALSGPLVQVLSEGSTLVIDELDTKLHPLLTRALVRAFHRADTGAQLIFTTHDCGLLDSSLFRRDQIWFTEKDRRGATDLYSLWDYDAHPVRGDENFREGYLRGRYGAIPFVGEFSFEREKEQAEAEGR